MGGATADAKATISNGGSATTTDPNNPNSYDPTGRLLLNLTSPDLSDRAVQEAAGGLVMKQRMNGRAQTFLGGATGVTPDSLGKSSLLGGGS
jgi:hypothetical protein